MFINRKKQSSGKIFPDSFASVFPPLAHATCTCSELRLVQCDVCACALRLVFVYLRCTVILFTEETPFLKVINNNS